MDCNTVISTYLSNNSNNLFELSNTHVFEENQELLQYFRVHLLLNFTEYRVSGGYIKALSQEQGINQGKVSAFHYLSVPKAPTT